MRVQQQQSTSALMHLLNQFVPSRFWNFNRNRKWRKPGAQTPAAATAAPAQPGQINQQLAGLRRKAAFRKAHRGELSHIACTLLSAL